MFIPLFMFNISKETFPKKYSSLRDKKLLYTYSIYIINN